MPPREPDDEEETENPWRGLARDLIVAAVIVALFVAAMYAYAGVWPPLVVVESSSMQHADRESFLGVIDTGDMVFQQAAPTRSAIVTYIEGRASGYATYGDFGDVIIFNRPGNPTPVIHRAIMYATVYPNGTADVLDLALPTFTNWTATNAAGPTTDPHYLETLTIRGMGFDHDLGITFNFPRDFMRFAPIAPRAGYITMGDHNAYLSCSLSKDPCRASLPYDTGWMPRQVDVIGRARGELPWFGLLKLTLQPTDSCCPGGWGDPEAPRNSWDSLLVGLVFLFALPFLLELAGRAFTKYVRPRLPKNLRPWRRKRRAADAAWNDADDPEHRDR